MVAACRRAVAVALLCGLAIVLAAPDPASATGGRRLPAHVFAPYFETWTNARLTTVARRSGARFLTLAFIEATHRRPCTPTWDGDPSQPISSGRYVADIATLRRTLEGDVIPSFGGYSADHALTEIADACMSHRRLVEAYESVVETYHVTRLDMDVEDRSLDNTAGINRRNAALATLERWAAEHHRPLQIEYTLPVEPGGLEANGLSVLRSAVRHHTRVDVVNIMTFDYYDGKTTDMGGAAIQAARRLFSQLRRLYPHKAPRQLWAMEGNTIMPGIDDYPRKSEVTTPADARRLLRFARSVGISTLSMWAIQRDNGGCPGKIGANNCSGIAQPRWAFSHLLGRFTG